MRRVMYEAEVGDDVFGEDPTVRRLEETAAAMLGKEAGLFVPTGVMANQLALKVHTRPGDEVLLERQSHILNYESGAAGLLSGVQTNVLDGERGILQPEQVARAVRPGNYWDPLTRLLCLENTVNKAGGVIYPLEQTRRIAEVVRQHGLRFHLDGARLWNAAVATGTPEADFAAPFDTVAVCFSKGLGAPVGSLLAGSKDVIKEAHRYRKLFGGGMRQVGILAAAALYALENHRADLATDHAHARRLAEGIAELPGFSVAPDRVETNIVMFDVQAGDAKPVLERLSERGVRMVQFGPATIRATTHRDVASAEIEEALSVMRALFG